MRRTLQLALLLAALAWCVPARAAIAQDGHCTGTTSCTLSGTATDDFLIVFAFRSGSTTAPSLPATWTSIQSGSGTTSSYNIGCRVATSGADTASGTWTNATRIVAVSYSGTGTSKGTTPGCMSAVGGHTTNNGTTSTLTFGTVTMRFGDSSSWVAGYSGSSSTVCTPTGMTVIDTGGAGPQVNSNDTGAGVGSWTSTNCTGGTGNWISYVIEILAQGCSGNVFGTWTCDSQSNVQACASPCTITLSSTTGAGHILLVTSLNGSGSTTISSVSGDGSWSTGTCHSTDATAGSADQAYNLNTTGGATSITVTMSSGSATFNVLEFHNSGTVAVDVCGTRDQSSAVTNPAGVTLTLGGSDDFIAQGITTAGNATAINSSYLFYVGTGGNAVGWKATASGTAPTWTTTSARAALLATAFKATASGGGTTAVPQQMMTGAGD